MIYGYFLLRPGCEFSSSLWILVAPAIKLPSTNSKKEQIKTSILNLKCVMVSHNSMVIAVTVNKLVHSEVTEVGKWSTTQESNQAVVF